MKQSTKIKWVVVLTIAQFQSLSAQTFEDDVPDSPPASIDQWWITLIVVIAAFVYILIKAKSQLKESNK
jgi:hypothetical protein